MDTLYFWTNPAEGFPDGIAFGQFTVAHLSTLAAMIVVAIGIIWLYKHFGDKQRRMIRLAIGIAVLAMEIARQAGFLLTGNYSPSILPLHLCAIATFCVFIDSVKPNSWTREYLYALGTWGPLCAMTFPDWASQPWFNIYSWQSFLIHALMLAYPYMLLVSGEFHPSLRNLWKVVVIMAVFVGVSLIANHVWDTNFWFLNTGAPGSPLEPIQAFAGAWYIPLLALLLAIIWAAMYLPWERRTANVTASMSTDFT